MREATRVSSSSRVVLTASVWHTIWQILAMQVMGTPTFEGARWVLPPTPPPVSLRVADASPSDALV